MTTHTPYAGAMSPVMPVLLRCYTWREALMVAAAAADRPFVATRPRVARLGDMWAVSFHEQPVAMNATAR